MSGSAPESLNAAIALQPIWIQIWILILVITNLAASCFVVTRQEQKWKARPEALAILASFFAAAIFMSWLFHQVGYVRLLGLPHLVFWLPVYIWLFNKYRKDAFFPPFKHYLLVYFVIAGISLVIDVLDVVRYLLGER